MWENIESNTIQILYNLGILAGAFILALPIAWDRERSRRKMGLRTFPLVAVASAGYVLVGYHALGGEPQPMARIIQGLVTGVGFLGGGAIVKEGLNVIGTATAASIWNTAAVGASVAFGRWEIGAALAVTNFLVLRFLAPLKDEIDGQERP